MTTIHFVRPVNNIKGFTPRGEIELLVESNMPIIKSFIIHPSSKSYEEKYSYCISVEYGNYNGIMFFSPSGMKFSNDEDEYFSSEQRGVYYNNEVYFTWIIRS